MIRFLLFNLLYIGSCGYALLRGGAPERIAAALLVVTIEASWLLLTPFSIRFRHVELGVFLVDIFLFVAFYALSLPSRRFWPIWIAAFQGMGMVSHLAVFAPHVIQWAYGNAVQLWSYPMLILLGVGTYRHRQRLKRTGRDRAWIWSSAI